MDKVMELAKAIRTSSDDKNKTAAYDTTAEVISIENGTAWVHIPGGVDRTPAKLVVDAKKGDSVRVRVSGGKAYVTGNATAPPTDDTKANKADAKATEAKTKADEAMSGAVRARAQADNAYEIADSASGMASDASKTANNAYKIADSTNQYFWFRGEGDDTGAHITEIPQSEWNDEDSENYHSGGNLLARSNGIAVRDGLTELATFGADGAQIGKSSGGHTTIQASGMQVYGNDGTLELANIGYGLGNSESGTAEAPYFTLGVRTIGSDVGNYSVAEGSNVTASAFGAHAEGVNTVASDFHAHAEGRATVASGHTSHAEGYGTTASGDDAHAEGYDTTAGGESSHAEGIWSEATGMYSHAQNEFTIAQRANQTAIGMYNVADTTGLDETNLGDYVLIIGNGTSNNARSNALTVDWSGNVEMGLPNYQSSGSTDKALYDAIVALGWQSEVIV